MMAISTSNEQRGKQLVYKHQPGNLVQMHQSEACQSMSECWCGAELRTCHVAKPRWVDPATLPKAGDSVSDDFVIGRGRLFLDCPTEL